MTWESEYRHAKEGVGGHGWTARISWIFGVIFVIVGVITEIIDTMFIVQSMSWYLLSIAAFGSGIINMTAWLGGIYLHGKKSEK
jgi:hypothetical protein